MGFPLPWCVERCAHFFGHLEVQAARLDVTAVRGDGVVVGERTGDRARELQPATGLEVGIRLRYEARPVAHGGHKVAPVDEVEVGSAVRPVILDVVDLEDAVRRDKGGLCGRDVDADDFAVGILVCEIHGPDAGPGAQIEHAAAGGLETLFWDGGYVQPVVEEERVLVVLEVLAV